MNALVKQLLSQWACSEKEGFSKLNIGLFRTLRGIGTAELAQGVALAGRGRWPQGDLTEENARKNAAATNFRGDVKAAFLAYSAIIAGRKINPKYTESILKATVEARNLAAA